MSAIIELQKVEVSDIDTLLKLSRETFFTAFYHLNNPDDMEAYAAKAFTIQRLEEELNTPGSTFYFALLNQEITGFIKLNTGTAQNEFKDQYSIEVERLYVLAQHQGKQIGQQMLNFAFDIAKKGNYNFVWLGVWEHNQKAIRLYERQGFTLCGSHKFMLGNDPQTDLLLRKDLSPTTS